MRRGVPEAIDMRTAAMSGAVCACGCGAATPLAPRTRARLGWVEGLPLTFLPRGNAPGAVLYRTGACARGHPRTPENTVLATDGSRKCRVCSRAYESARHRERYRTDPVYVEKARARARAQHERRKREVSRGN